MMNKLLIGLFVSICLIGLASAWTDNGSAFQNVNGCNIANTTDAVYNLTSNVTFGGTCFYIKANNITFNGNGYTINFSNNGTVGYGFNVTSFNFTTIKNTKILEGSTSGGSKHGIYLLSANNITIQNNTINESGGNGIEVQTSSNNTLINNTILANGGGQSFRVETSSNNNNISYNNMTSGASGTTAFGVYILTTSNNNTVQNNTIFTAQTNCLGIRIQTQNNLVSNNIVSTSGNTAYGISVTIANNNTVLNNNVTTTGTSSYGIYVIATSSNDTIQGNTINTTGSNAYGIYIPASNITITNNNISTLGTQSYGVFFDTGANNSTAIGNTIITKGSTAYGMLFNINQNDSASNNTITTYGDSSHGIRVVGVQNNSFSGFNITTYNVTANGIFISVGNQNFTVADTIINATVQELGIASSATGGAWNFTNVTRLSGSQITISWNAIAVGTLNYGWWLNTISNYSNGTLAQNVNISDYNNNSLLQNTSLSDALGSTKQSLLQYVQTGTGGNTTTYYSNYTINATEPLSSQNLSSIINMTTNRQIIFTFNSGGDITPPNATLILPLNNSFLNNASVNFTVNVSDDTSLKNVSVNIYNSSNNLVNQTWFTAISGNLSAVVTTIVNLADGVYNWFASVFDTANNNFKTQNKTFSIDTIAPAITIISPTNITYNTNNINLYYTVFDINLAICKYSLDSAINVTLVGCINTTLSGLSDGSHNITVYANDTYGNVNFANIAFNINTTTIITGGGNGGPPNTGLYYINNTNLTGNLTSNNLTNASINKSKFSSTISSIAPSFWIIIAMVSMFILIIISAAVLHKRKFAKKESVDTFKY